MKKIEILSKKNPNFIGCWNMENKKICENIIRFFEDNPKLQYQGETASGQEISPTRSRQNLFNLFLIIGFVVVSI